MKFLKHFLPLLLLGVTLTGTGCFFDIDDDDGLFGCVNGDGPLVTEELDLPPFDGVMLRMSADVFITQGPDFEVVVEGKPNIIDELELDVDNGVWEIETDDCVRDIGDMRIFITMPDVRRLHNSASGHIISENVLLVNDIELTLSGSGDIDVAVEADDIQSRISGSGHLLLEGVANDLEHRGSGSGDLRAFNLQVREADINLSGSGDAEVRVSDFLRVRISGSGDVLYKGDPNIDTNISGSGDLVDAN